jgi:predicted HNH restriction endonuclease
MKYTTKKCSRCFKIKKISFFRQDKQKKDGLCSWCNECQDEYSTQRHKTHSKNYANTARERRKRGKRWAIEYKGAKCARCGEQVEDVCYDFHHLNPKQKEISVGVLMDRKKEAIIKEIKKCIMVCANCHRIIHKELRDALYQ